MSATHCSDVCRPLSGVHPPGRGGEASVRMVKHLAYSPSAAPKLRRWAAAAHLATALVLPTQARARRVRSAAGVLGVGRGGGKGKGRHEKEVFAVAADTSRGSCYQICRARDSVARLRIRS
eukprot:6208524-Pleurochrysis_carterae.AAC.4